jgi:DNA-binding response OmpR family regulator
VSTPSAECRVLAVDEDVEMRRTLSNCLAAEGFHVVSAGTATEAERCASDGDYACILINLRWQESLTLLRRLRPLLPTTPVVLATAIPGQPMHEHLAPLGVRGLLLKPFGLDELLSLLRELTGRSD